MEAGARRGAPRPADGHGPARRPGRAARRAHARAGLRPAGHLDRRRPARGGHLPRLHHRRPGHGADHAPDRDPQGEHAGPAVLCRGPEAAEGPAGRAEEAGRRPDPRRSSPPPPCSACCRRCCASGSRSATCRPSWKASARPRRTPPRSPTLVEQVRARLARQLCCAYRGDDGALPIITLSAEWENAFADALVGAGRGEAAGPGPVAPAGLHPRRARDLRARRPGRRQRRCC